MSKLLTISIAAYNMEKYIRETLDSLIDERVINDLEIFVVDDGGTDKTLDIAKEYAEKYPDSIIPVHKENGGYGTTVNYSLAHATGKYFKLLDGDDWFDKEGLYKMITTLKKVDADVIITEYKQGPDIGNLQKIYIKGIEANKVIEINKLDISRAFSMWEIAYKTEIAKKSGLELPSKMLYTDQIYATVPFSAAQTIYYIDSCLYCYRLGRDGQSVSKESRIKHLGDYLNICVQLCNFYEEQSRCNCINIKYLQLRTSQYIALAFKLLLLPPLSNTAFKTLKEFDNKINRMSPDTYSYAEKCGKAGKLLQWFRKTNYIIYYPLKPLLDVTFLKNGF